MVEVGYHIATDYGLARYLRVLFNNKASGIIEPVLSLKLWVN